MTETLDECNGSRSPKMAPLEFTADHEIEAFRQLSPKEAKERALAALSCLHKGLPDVAQLVLALGVNSGKAHAYKTGIITSPHGVPVASHAHDGIARPAA